MIGVAPYWNTDPAGQVCLGSMPMPGSAGLDSLAEWVEGFFRSEFTHSGATKLTKHPQGHFGLWRELAGKDRFPAEWIVPAGSLEEWLRRNQ
jgi:PRTRC genetic system protein B